jgi:hypothetical protein
LQEIEFIKPGSLSPKELDTLVSVLELAGGKLGQNKTVERKPREGTTKVPSAEKSVASLESMGVIIYGLDEARDLSSNTEISWDNIAGYDQQKRYVRTRVCCIHCCYIFIWISYTIPFFNLQWKL